MDRKLLLKNARIVTRDPGLGDIARGDILVEGDTIREIRPGLAAAEAEIFDAEGMIAIPGLVNAHVHTWESGLKGIGTDWVSPDYMRHIHHGTATVASATDNYYANLVGALGQIESGVTTMFDWCHNLRNSEMTDASVDGLEESGIRAVFGHAMAKPPEVPGQKPYWEIPHSREEIRRLRTGRFASDDRLVTLAMAILGPDLSTYEVSKHDILLAREYGLINSAHTWGRKGRRMTPDGMWRLNAEGLLGPDHNIAHGNCMDDNEIKMILDAGCSYTASAVPEMLGSQDPTVLGRVEDHGGVASLGTDTYPHYSASMLLTMRFAFQHQREHDNRALGEKGAWPAKKHRTTSRMALDWATIQGARSLRMEDRIGSLTPGKKADIVLVRTDRLGIFPAFPGGDPVGIVVMSAETADIDAVIIGGRFVKKNGALTYPREKLDKAKQGLMESRARLFAHQGLSLEMASA